MTDHVRLAQHEGYIFIVRTMMTPTQVRLAQASFGAVEAQAAEASRVFYEELFHLAPERRVLFPGDMNTHRHKFFQMLALLIKNLDRVAAVSEDIVDLGYRHLTYDVGPEDYQVFGQALLRMLDKLLGRELTPETRESWAAAYDTFARLMQEATEDARSSESFYSRIIRDVMVAQYGVVLRSEMRSTGRASNSKGIDSGKVIRLS